MAWVQFPFPRCPSCGESWAVSRHRGCDRSGSIEVEPDSRRVRCDACFQQWAIWDTNFHCVCGWQFTTGDVTDAIEQIVYAARLLASLIDQHQHEVARIRSQGRESFGSWLNSIAQRVGGTLGRAMGYVVGSIVRGFL